MNNVVLIGRLTRDPDLRFVSTTGMAVTNFTLAVNREVSKEKQAQMAQQGKATADFIYVTVFGKSAENCANFLNKGSLCGVHGKITTGSYEKDGTKQYKTGVTADRVEFLESKNKGQAKNNESNFDNDIFTPVDDEEIPF